MNDPHLLESQLKRSLAGGIDEQEESVIVHPNVMPILSVNEKSRLPFLVMPYVACHSLQQRLDADGPLPLLDMSPEQARGDAIDTRSDLFSFGSVIYAMCVGRPPFRAETSYGILRRITDHAPRSLWEINTNVPVWLDRLVRRLLTKDASHRYASAQDVAVLRDERALNEIAADGAVDDAQISAEISRLQIETERVVQNAEAVWPPADQTFDDVKSVTAPLPVLPRDSNKGN